MKIVYTETASPVQKYPRLKNADHGKIANELFTSRGFTRIFAGSKTVSVYQDDSQMANLGIEEGDQTHYILALSFRQDPNENPSNSYREVKKASFEIDLPQQFDALIEEATSFVQKTADARYRELNAILRKLRSK